MSSKKQVRRQRLERAREEKTRGGRGAVVGFILFIVVALVAVGAGAFFFSGEGAGGTPPFPGAVWSQAHGHWH